MISQILLQKYDLYFEIELQTWRFGWTLPTSGQIKQIIFTAYVKNLFFEDPF
jgi:hypothetical protein